MFSRYYPLQWNWPTRNPDWDLIFSRWEYFLLKMVHWFWPNGTIFHQILYSNFPEIRGPISLPKSYQNWGRMRSHVTSLFWAGKPSHQLWAQRMVGDGSFESHRCDVRFESFSSACPCGTKNSCAMPNLRSCSQLSDGLPWLTTTWVGKL